MFNVTLAAAATVSVSVEVADDYLLVVSRPQQDKLNVGVKKAKSNTLGVSIGASIAASFTNPDDIIGLLEPLVSGLVDQPIAKIDELLAKISYDDLSDELKGIADNIAKRLNLDDAQSAFTSLKDKLTEIKTDAISGIRKSANIKAEMAFAYEYKRVEQSQMMLEVLMSDDQFAGFHKTLIKGNLTPVLDEVRKPNSAIKLKQFLNQQTLEVSKSFGFSFGLGDWTVKSADVSSFKEVKRIDLQGHQQISFKGSKGFEGSSREWTTDFNASMAEFSKSAIPKANEFDFAYSINHQSSGQSASVSVLNKMVDLALLWRIIPQGDGEELVASLKEKLAGQKNITFNHSIKLDNDAFNAILPDLKIHDNQAFGACLGQAMPWDGGWVTITFTFEHWGLTCLCWCKKHPLQELTVNVF